MNAIMKVRFLCSVLLWASICLSAMGQMEDLPQGHPRYLTNADSKQETLQLIKEEAWAQDVFERLEQRTSRYADLGEDWLSSRLRMYWNTHATNYRRPKLEELQPCQEDPKGMYLANSTLEGNPYEWVSIGKTGRMIESINREIMGYARDGAFLWWLTGEEKYARMAASVFDTYMTGIYYRNVPVDLNNGHQQTLVGMTSFEVIHEDILNELVPLYDFLYDYLKQSRPEKMEIYAEAFKKWIENIIANGVPHNNWNLIQARFIMNVAMILEDNTVYPATGRVGNITLTMW